MEDFTILISTNIEEGLISRDRLKTKFRILRRSFRTLLSERVLVELQILMLGPMDIYTFYRSDLLEIIVRIMIRKTRRIIAPTGRGPYPESKEQRTIYQTINQRWK